MTINFSRRALLQGVKLLLLSQQNEQNSALMHAHALRQNLPRNSEIELSLVYEQCIVCQLLLYFNIAAVISIIAHLYRCADIT
jgi:hypothetical protein